MNYVNAKSKNQCALIRRTGRDFWKYFEPVRQNMPANCSADVQAVIAHVDKIFNGRNTAAIQALKDNWGLGNLSHVEDVAGACKWLFLCCGPCLDAGCLF